jgi:hypothetical protein
MPSFSSCRLPGTGEVRLYTDGKLLEDAFGNGLAGFEVRYSRISQETGIHCGRSVRLSTCHWRQHINI